MPFIIPSWKVTRASKPGQNAHHCWKTQRGNTASSFDNLTWTSWPTNTAHMRSCHPTMGKLPAMINPTDSLVGRRATRTCRASGRALRTQGLAVACTLGRRSLG